LAELLIVIGIIALLSAILFPAFAKARAKAQEIKCASNLRAWGQAFMAYAASNYGTLPHYGDFTFNPNPYGQNDLDDPNPLYAKNRLGYTDVLPPLMGDQAWVSYPLNQRPTGGFWQCPAAEIKDNDTNAATPSNIYDYKPGIYGYHSYAMNCYLEADNPGLVRRVPPPFLPQQPSFLMISRAKWASETFLMYEVTLIPGQTYGLNSVNPDCYCGFRPGDSGGEIAFYHPHQPGKPGVNTLMLDGHVEWTDTLRDPNNNTGSWLPDPTDHRWWPFPM
jgi:prepilin-type processing-associated H-X9-DG protein